VDIGIAKDLNNVLKNIIPDHNNVISGTGSFCGQYRLSGSDLVIVSSTDSIGTKLLLASEYDRLEDIGRDLVNHCINDIIVCGARPLFFQDYIGHCDLGIWQLERIIRGIADECLKNNIALIGGETAQMPGIYNSSIFDVAGFIVGVVSEEGLVKNDIQENDVVIAIASNGLHTNGYSLARDILSRIPDHEKNKTVELLLAPHTNYLPAVNLLLSKVAIKGMAHITGGGVVDNVMRIIPSDCDVVIYKNNAPELEIFSILAPFVSDEEMFRVFNMGFGFIIVFSDSDKDSALSVLGDSPYLAFEAGYVKKGSGNVDLI